MTAFIRASTSPILTGALAIAIVLGVFAVLQRQNNTDEDTIQVGDTEFHVQIADTPALRQQGLSGQAPLASNEGMLFFFPAPDYYTIWMKDMRFPIDIIWIRNGMVVDITHHAAPEPGVPDEHLTRYRSAEPVDRVLEINADTATREQITIGSPASFYASDGGGLE